jgi:hypothetical protein
MVAALVSQNILPPSIATEKYSAFWAQTPNRGLCNTTNNTANDCLGFHNKLNEVPTGWKQ